jgi:hypothetical protein
MNMVETWFSIAEHQAIHRGNYRFVRDLTHAIRRFIDAWTNRAVPFTWTKTATEISPRPCPGQLQTRSTSCTPARCAARNCR